MSKLGKLPVAVPAGVTVTVNPDSISVKGPKGELHQHYGKNVKVSFEDGNIHVIPNNASKQANADHGLYRSLIKDMVIGVTAGFSKSLIITGVGFRAEVKGKELVMNLGFFERFYRADPRRTYGCSRCERQSYGVGYQQAASRSVLRGDPQFAQARTL